MKKTINDIIREKHLEIFKNEFIHSFMEDFNTTWGNLSLEEINEKQKTWSVEDMAYGLDGLNNSKFYPLYEDQNLKDIGLIYSPAKKPKDHYLILLSGGAFGSCCNLAEGFPVARKLNEMGFSTFTLTYRTAQVSSFMNGLMPDPIEDLKNAIKFIQKNQAIFSIDSSNYSLIGFSAGSYVTASFCLKYQEYQLPKPKGVLLMYPLLDINSVTNPKLKELFFQGLYGGLYGIEKAKEKEKNYNIFNQINDNYPQTYIVAAKDDNTIPLEDIPKLISKLNHLSIPSKYLQVEYGGHGFGLGSLTDAFGYLEHYLNFIGEKYE